MERSSHEKRGNQCRCNGWGPGHTSRAGMESRSHLWKTWVPASSYSRSAPTLCAFPQSQGLAFSTASSVLVAEYNEGGG